MDDGTAVWYSSLFSISVESHTDWFIADGTLIFARQFAIIPGIDDTNLSRNIGNCATFPSLEGIDRAWNRIC